MFNCAACCNVSYAVLLLLFVCAHANKPASAKGEFMPINVAEKELEKEKLQEKCELHGEDTDAKREAKESESKLKPGDDD